MSNPMNLVVYLARTGLGSRRSCDQLVQSGAVTVNGEVVTFPRHKVGPEDVVAVNGEALTPRELRYVLVNKPKGVASTRSDPHAEKVIVDMVPNGRVLFPVGRLDVGTTGVIILTNDGVLANRLMHPRYGVPKTYVVRVRGKVSRRMLGTLRQGVELEDGPTSPAEVDLRKQSAKTALVEVTIHEGRKRQVRRMFQAVGLPVEDLHRRRYGPLSDKGLEPGGWRELNGDEIDALRRAGEAAQDALADEPQGEAVLLAGESPAARAERIAAEEAGSAMAPATQAPEQATAGDGRSIAEPEPVGDEADTRLDEAAEAGGVDAGGVAGDEPDGAEDASGSVADEPDPVADDRDDAADESTDGDSEPDDAADEPEADAPESPA